MYLSEERLKPNHKYLPSIYGWSIKVDEEEGYNWDEWVKLGSKKLQDLSVELENKLIR